MKTLLFLTLLLAVSISNKYDDSLLIDDFSDKTGVSSLGTRWFSIADSVMGGVSKGQARYEMLDKENCLRLRGTVSLDNNGGFIQVALPLRGRGSFDASRFDGIRLRVQGNGERYYIHLRTGQTNRPWRYFYAGFNTSPEWQDIEIPFVDFKFENGRGGLDKSDLYRVAIVAAKKAFEADVAVSRIELYKKSSSSDQMAD